MCGSVARVAKGRRVVGEDGIAEEEDGGGVVVMVWCGVVAAGHGLGSWPPEPARRGVCREQEARSGGHAGLYAIAMLQYDQPGASTALAFVEVYRALVNFYGISISYLKYLSYVKI